jgi:hypothetical protein
VQCAVVGVVLGRSRRQEVTEVSDGSSVARAG